MGAVVKGAAAARMTEPPRFRAAGPLLAAALFACGDARSADRTTTSITESETPVVLPDLDGAEHRPLDVDGAKANVLVFSMLDCPIANGYSPEIMAIADEFAPQGLRFFLVCVDPDATAEAARQHASDYSLELPILLDREHVLVSALEATITPEAAVVGAGGELLYRGRIDDLYAALGKKRVRPTRHDLRLALAAVVEGRPVEQPRTEAVGCFIPDLD